jgi:hypothetical protein
MGQVEMGREGGSTCGRKKRFSQVRKGERKKDQMRAGCVPTGFRLRETGGPEDRIPDQPRLLRHRDFVGPSEGELTGG